MRWLALTVAYDWTIPGLHMHARIDVNRRLIGCTFREGRPLRTRTDSACDDLWKLRNKRTAVEGSYRITWWDRSPRNPRMDRYTRVRGHKWCLSIGKVCRCAIDVIVGWEIWYSLCFWQSDSIKRSKQSKGVSIVFHQLSCGHKGGWKL